MNRRAMLRLAAPAAFLAGLTIAVLLIRAGLRHDSGTTASTAATPTAPALTSTLTIPVGSTTTSAAKRFYTVQSGDTLQVTTVVYRLHSNATLGPQRNIVVRGVPAVVYDEGRSIELYTGRVAIDVFSDTFTHVLAASERVQPLNAPAASSGNLPPPVYCPGLSGPAGADVQKVLERLPGRICQHTQAETAFANSLS